MKFICNENGKLLKGAPGNYKCGEQYKQPFKMSKFAYWQLLETPAELKAPSLGEGDNVFDDDVIYVPDDPDEKEGEVEDEVVEDAVVETATVEMTPARIIEDSGVNVDPSAPATIEPYMSYNTGTGKLSPSTYTASGGDYVVEATEEPTEEPTEEEEAVNPDELDRDELKRFLDEVGVLYKDKTRTSTLKKMVDELVKYT